MAMRDFRGKTSRSGPQPMLPPAEKAETYIDQGCNFSGTLRFKDSVRIDGHVEGEIVCDKTVIVGEAAMIDAALRAESVEVYGTITGDIRVQRKTVLHKTACVHGEIQTAGIVVEEGARLKGTIVIGGDDSEAAETDAVPAEPRSSAKTNSAASKASPAAN